MSADIRNVPLLYMNMNINKTALDHDDGALTELSLMKEIMTVVWTVLSLVEVI